MTSRFSAYAYMRAVRDHDWPTARTRLHAVAIADELALRADRRGRAWPGVRLLESRSGLRRRYHAATFTALTAAGFLAIGRLGRAHRNIYQLGIALPLGLIVDTTTPLHRGANGDTTTQPSRSQNDPVVVTVRDRKSPDRNATNPPISPVRSAQGGERARAHARAREDSPLLSFEELQDQQTPDRAWAIALRDYAARYLLGTTGASFVDQTLEILHAGISRDRLLHLINTERHRLAKRPYFELYTDLKADLARHGHKPHRTLPAELLRLQTELRLDIDWSTEEAQHDLNAVFSHKSVAARFPRHMQPIDRCSNTVNAIISASRTPQELRRHDERVGRPTTYNQLLEIIRRFAGLEPSDPDILAAQCRESLGVPDTDPTMADTIDHFTDATAAPRHPSHPTHTAEASK